MIQLENKLSRWNLCSLAQECNFYKHACAHHPHPATHVHTHGTANHPLGTPCSSHLSSSICVLFYFNFFIFFSLVFPLNALAYFYVECVILFSSILLTISHGSHLLTIARSATERQQATNAETTRIGAGADNNKAHSKQSGMEQPAGVESSAYDCTQQTKVERRWAKLRANEAWSFSIELLAKTVTKQRDTKLVLKSRCCSKTRKLMRNYDELKLNWNLLCGEVKCMRRSGR